MFLFSFHQSVFADKSSKDTTASVVFIEHNQLPEVLLIFTLVFPTKYHCGETELGTDISNVELHVDEILLECQPIHAHCNYHKTIWLTVATAASSQLTFKICISVLQFPFCFFHCHCHCTVMNFRWRLEILFAIFIFLLTFITIWIFHEWFFRSCILSWRKKYSLELTPLW